MANLSPGLAFSIQTASGYAVGLYSHRLPKVGYLIWIAAPTFEKPPTLSDLESISKWRWPVLYPLASALRDGAVSPIANVQIPESLRDFPTLRSGHKALGWTAFRIVDGLRQRLGSTRDSSLPIYQIVNDAALREMVETEWIPEDDF